MWLDKVADIFRQAFSPLGLKRPREDRLPTDGYKETVHASKRPAAAYNGNGKEPMQIKSVRIEEANNGEYLHGSKAYEWREFPSPSTRQISNPHQMKDEQEEIPNHPLVVKEQQSTLPDPIQMRIRRSIAYGKAVKVQGGLQATQKPQVAGTSPRKSSGPYPVHEEKYGVATGADGRCTSNIVSDLAFLDRRLSFARAEKLGEPLAHSSKAPARHVLYLPEAEGEVAFAADLAYKKYSQRQDQLRVLVSKAKTIISEKRERDFSQELKLLQEELKKFQALRRKKEVPELKEFQITDKEKDEFKKLVSKPADDVLAADPKSNIEIKGRDMARLAPGVWLNDEIINIYISLLQQRDYRMRQTGTWPKCHFFNSFFYAKLNDKQDGYRYSNVRRWTLPARLKKTSQASTSILDCDLIIVPVNLSNTHWVCASIDLKNQQFAYYDSLGGEDEFCLDNLANYLKDEFADKKGEERKDVLEWPKMFPKDIPRQSNFSDCGVFTIIFANFLGKGRIQDFSPDAVENFRVRVAMDIMRLSVD